MAPRVRCSSFLLVAAAAPFGREALASPPSLRTFRVEQPPTIEDALADSTRAGARISGFRQREPGDGNPVSESTNAYLSYDSRNVYVIFVCRDDPAKIRAHMAKREDLGDDDTVTVFFDTFHDRQHAYFFASNAYGIQSDGILTEGAKRGDTSFDTVWQSEARLLEDGYAVLFRIPFRSLRFHNELEQKWGIALERNIARKNETAFWPEITLRKQGFVQQMARLEGLEEISPGRNFQLTPYFYFSNGRLFDEGGSRFANRQDHRGGMDAKFVLKDALTLDLTANPDFSQVESDDPQVVVNQRYEVFFPEKRPFFLENAGYFATPINLFFSRRIQDPEFGARMSGKLGRWAVGLLGADDRAPGRLTSNPSWTGDRAVNGILRVQREFGIESRAGVLVTSRDFGPSSSRVASFDARLRLTPTWFFTGQLAKSFEKPLSGIALRGTASFAEIAHTSRNFAYSGTYSDLTPDFRAGLGFIQRVDIRAVSQYAGYFWRPKNKRILSFGPAVSVGSDWDHKNVLQDWFLNADFGIDFASSTGVRVTRYQTLERYIDRSFRHFRNGASAYTGRLKWLYLYASYGRGTAVNYRPSGSYSPFLANSTDASFGFNLKPKPRLHIDQIYYLSRLTVHSGAITKIRSGSVYNNHLLRTKVNFQFTKALSIRGILDYNGLLSNPSFIRQGTYKQLTGDILLTYLIHPGTALYVGYTNNHQNLLFDPITSDYRRAGPPSFLTGTQFFVKISYLFRP